GESNGRGGAVMSRRPAHILSMLAELLRRFWWATVSGFSVIGGTMYGGAPVAAAWQRYVDPRYDPPAEPDSEPGSERLQPTERACPVADDVIRREAARGVAELESFLAAYRDIPRGDRP
ncbi:hypothetical protein, partial [Haloactinopolyspora sp.]|uniref:hypothetical protein n=1 Tax=Haloactinopolyspora sp. TaxID=1966353 RepID=UPI00260F3650